MTFTKLKHNLYDAFEWLGDINLSERSHIIVQHPLEKKPNRTELIDPFSEALDGHARFKHDDSETSPPQGLSKTNKPNPTRH